MSVSDRIKAAAEKVKERASSGGERAREAAANAQLSDRQRRAAARARERAAQAAQTVGDADPDGVPKGGRSRTKAMFARAQRYATSSAPVETSLDPSPSGDDMWAFAEAGRGGTPTKFRGQQQSANGQQSANNQKQSEPDWGDNPDNLDSPEEVREELRADDLDPMGVASQQEAQFGHMLVHSFEDDPDRGGRTPEQLEAEHDMVVSALDDFGVDHETPMDADEVEFADPFGASGSQPAGEREREDERERDNGEFDDDAGAVWGWF